MSSLQHYRKGSIVLICPVDKDTPVIEATIADKAQGRGKERTRVKVHVPFPLDIFGDKHKGVEGTFTQARDTAWLNPAGWKVLGKVK